MIKVRIVESATMCMLKAKHDTVISFMEGIPFLPHGNMQGNAVGCSMNKIVKGCISQEKKLGFIYISRGSLY